MEFFLYNKSFCCRLPVVLCLYNKSFCSTCSCCCNDVSVATLSVYPHRASLKNMPGHGGIRTYDLWNASPTLYKLSYAVKSVRVYDISELSLVPSISMYSIYDLLL